MIMPRFLRQWWTIALVIPAFWVSSATAADPVVKVAKTRTCGCCQIWVDYLKKEGFTVETRNMATGELTRFKIRHGIRPHLASCHTGRVAGYTVEGHVPAREIRRLLAERPDAVGLSVPGMPLGSPGMDMGPDREPYDVLLIKRDGKTSVYASYGAK